MRHAVAASAVFTLCAALAYWLHPALERAPPGPASAPEDAEPVSPPTEASPGEETPGLEAILERLPALARDPALAPIRGRVQLADGGPVTGARVEARIDATSAPGLSLLDRVRGWAEEAHASRDGGVIATTDAAGWFELRGLVHADYRLEASHPELWIWPRDPGKERHRPGDQVDFFARRERAFELEIDVVGPDGRPEEATIEIDLQGASLAERAAFPADGQLATSRWGWSFPWSPSNRLLKVAWDGTLVAHGPGGTISERVAVSLAEPRGQITLRLAEPRGIALEVRRPEGSEKIVSRLAVMRIDPGRPPTLARFARGAKWLGSERISYPVDGVALEGAPSRPVISDIPPGTYQIGVTLTRPERRTSWFSSGPQESPRGGRVDGWTTVQVTTGLAKARIEIAEPAMEGGILARIIGPDGQLLDGVVLVLWRKDDKKPSPQQVPIDWDRRSDGSYLVLPQEDIAALLAGGEPGSLELAATHPKFSEARGAVTPGQPAAAEVSFREPGRLEVVVTGTDDVELVARVRAELRAGTGPRAGSGRLGSASMDGTVMSYDRIAPGDYEARVSFSCGGGELELHSGPVSIESGQTRRLEVRLPEVHPVEVRAAAGGSRRDPFREIVVRGEGLRCRVRPSSRAERLFLPPGDYEVVSQDRRTRTDGPPLLRFKLPGVDAIEIPGEVNR